MTAEAEKVPDVETPQSAAGGPSPPSEAPIEGPPASDSEAPAPPPKPKAKDFADVARERQRMLRQQEKIRAQFAQQKAEVEQQLVEAKAKSQEADKILDIAKKLQTEPEKALQLLGIDKETYFRRLVNDGAPSPEEMVSLAVQEAREAKKALEEFKAEQAKLKAENERQNEERRFNAALQGFSQSVFAAPDKYPHLNAECDEADVASQVREVVAMARELGHEYSDQEIAEFLEERAKRQYTAREQRRTKVREFLKSEPETEGSTKPVNGRAASRPGNPRTLTNKAASERASAPKELSPDEKDAWALEELKKAFRAQAQSK